MIGINETFAMCLTVPLIVVSTVILLLGIKRVNWFLIGLIISAMILVILIEHVSQPIYERLDLICGGPPLEYLACKEGQKIMGLDLRSRFYLLGVAAPIFLLVTLSKCLLWVENKFTKERDDGKG